MDQDSDTPLNRILSYYYDLLPAEEAAKVKASIETSEEDRDLYGGIMAGDYKNKGVPYETCKAEWEADMLNLKEALRVPMERLMKKQGDGKA